MTSATYQQATAPSQEVLAKYLNTQGKATLYKSEARRSELKETLHKGKLGTMNLAVGTPISVKVEVDDFTTKTLFGNAAKAYMAADKLFNKIEQAKLQERNKI